MRDIIENRLKLPWEPQVLDFHANNRSVQTHSQSRKYQFLCSVQLGVNFSSNRYGADSQLHIIFGVC